MPRIESCLDLDASFLIHLKRIKVFSVLDFINEDTDKLTTSLFSAKEILALKHKLILKCVNQHENAAERYKVCLRKSAIMPTHIECLDDLLSGGLESGNIYELVGFSGTGKSQLCFSIVANIVSKLKRKAFILDTKNDFSADRIQRILAAQKYTEEDITSSLKRIDVFHVSDLYHIISTLQSIRDSLQNSGKHNYRLLIIDSMTAPFLEFVGSQQSNEGYALLIEVGATLKLLAREMFLAIIVTNLATRYCEGDPEFSLGESESSTEGGKIRPAMGRPWTHIPHVRLSLQQTSTPETSLLTIVKSNSLPMGKSKSMKISL